MELMTDYLKRLWKAAFWLSLLAMLSYSWWAMSAGSSRLNESLAKENDCRRLTNDIKRLRNRPGFAALTIDSPRTITTCAEKAGQEAKLPASSLVRIEPQSAIRLGDSPYRLRPTRLELRRVTLQQVIQFSHAMIDESQGTTLRDLRLTSSDPQGEGPSRTGDWEAEIVLTQLIFAPRAAERQ